VFPQRKVHAAEVALVYGHLPYGFDRWWSMDGAHPNATSYGTFVRKPVERVWSMYWWHHTEKHPLIERFVAVCSNLDKMSALCSALVCV
jgi:hypothetical protein